MSLIFLNFYFALYILLVVFTGSCKLEEFIFTAYYSIIEFVIMLACLFSHQSGIRALWLRGYFSTCLNDEGTYEDDIIEWSKLSLLEGQDEGLSICEEYASSSL